MAKPRTGTIKVSMYNIKYKLTTALWTSHVAKLEMRYGNKPWKKMQDITLPTSRSRLYDWARVYAKSERLFKT